MFFFIVLNLAVRYCIELYLTVLDCATYVNDYSCQKYVAFMASSSRKPVVVSAYGAGVSLRAFF